MTTDNTTTEDLRTTPPAGRVRAVRRPWRRLTAVLAAASLALVWLAAAPAQAQSTQCTGTLQNGTVLGAVVVPDGAACILINMNVLGNVSVGKGSDLLMESSMVAALKGAEDSFVFAAGGSVVAGGGTTMDHGFGLWFVDSIAFGGVALKTDMSTAFPVMYISDDTSYAGNLELVGAWSILRGGQINGSVLSEPGRATDIDSMTVTGRVEVRRSQHGSLLCGIALGGNLWVSGSGDVVQIGGPFPTPSCSSNFVNGHVDVHGNSANEIQISANIIGGDLRCTGNTPAPVGFGNIVFGTTSGQCAGLSILGGGLMSTVPLIPPPDVPGSREATTYDERRVEIEERLTERLAAAGGSFLIAPADRSGKLPELPVPIAP